MKNEINEIEMCLIKQKNFLHNLLSMKEQDIEVYRLENFIYSKKEPFNDEEYFVVKLRGINKINQSTIQFLLYVLHLATIKNLTVDNRILYLNPQEYKGYRNLKHQDNLRDKINHDLKVLINMYLEFEDTVPNDYKKKSRSRNVRINMNICSSTTNYRKKVISIAFTPEFIKYYHDLPCMRVPKEIFSIDTRKNKNAVSILWKLATLKNMNKNKSNNGIIYVSNLLNCCPCIPSYEDIKSTGQIKQRIINPLIRDLNCLKSIKWEFIDRNNNVVKEVNRFIDLIDLKIKYDFVNEDDTEICNI